MTPPKPIKHADAYYIQISENQKLREIYWKKTIKAQKTQKRVTRKDLERNYN